MKKAIGGLLTLAAGQVWLATRDPLPKTDRGAAPVGFKAKGFTLFPLAQGLPDTGVNGMPPEEFESYLRHGYAYEGSVVIAIDQRTADVTLIGGFGMSAITGTSAGQEQRAVLLEIERAAEWMQRIARPAMAPEPARLAAALQRLEDANEDLAAHRSQMLYDVMIGEGHSDRLVELDYARREAREALKSTPCQLPEHVQMQPDAEASETQGPI